MVKLGSKNRKLKLVEDDSDFKEFIDEGFFQIEFTINGKVFKKAVDGLLKFESDELGELTDAEIDQALVQCSYYRFTFLAAGAEIESKLATIEREYLQWYAEVAEQASVDIMTDRKELKEREKVPSGWFGSITKQQIEHRIILDSRHRERYEAHEAQVTEMKKTIKLLYGLRDILQDRGGHLQSIGRRRLENRKMNFGVSDVS